MGVEFVGRGNFRGITWIVCGSVKLRAGLRGRFNMWCSFVGTPCYSSLTTVGENAGMVGFGLFLATLKSALLGEKRVRISRLGNSPTILACYVCITYARHLFSGPACRACAGAWFNMWCSLVGTTCYSSRRLVENCNAMRRRLQVGLFLGRLRVKPLF